MIPCHYINPSIHYYNQYNMIYSIAYEINKIKQY